MLSLWISPKLSKLPRRRSDRRLAALLLVAAAAVYPVQTSAAETTLATFQASIAEDTPIVPIGKDRFLVIEEEAAYIWDGRARRGYPVQNTGRWNSPKAVALGAKVLIVGHAVPKGEDLARVILKRTGRANPGKTDDLLLYDPDTQSGVSGKLDVAAYGSTLSAISDKEAWVVGGYDKRVVERIMVTANGQLKVDRLPDLIVPRNEPGVARLQDGRVMAIVGRSKTAEIFDPTTQRWGPGGSPGIDSRKSPLVVMPDGRVVIFLGTNMVSVWKPAFEQWETFNFENWISASTPVIIDEHRIAGVAGKYLNVLDLRNMSLSRLPLTLHRFAMAARLSNGEIHVIGGAQSNQTGPNIEILNVGLDKAEMAGQGQSTRAVLADPLPLNLEETLFVYGNVRSGWGDRTTSSHGEQRNWRTGRTKQLDLSFLPVVYDQQTNLQRYTVAATSAGLWMVGPHLALLRPDGRHHLINLPDYKPLQQGEYRKLEAAGLDDGSVLVSLAQRKLNSGRYGWSAQMYRLSLQADGAGIQLQPIPSAPRLDSDIEGDIAAIKLADGKILVSGVAVGEGSRRELQFWLYNPRNDSWQRTGNLNHTRKHMAMAALPDGRAFVAGGESDGSVTGGRADVNHSSGRRGEVSRTVELWDPGTGQWDLLPSMPLSFKIKAHNAVKPSAAALPDGSLAVGGGMHRHVLLLRARGKSFAPYWTVAGSTPGQRVNGVLQVLGNNEMLVLGGVAPLPNNGGCCRRQTGGDRIVWKGDGMQRKESVSLARPDSAVAHRGDLSFAAGGWEAYMFSSRETQASSIAELIDHRSGRVQELPPLPHSLLAGRAMWLDDDRILIKAHQALYGSDFQSSLEHATSGFLAIFSQSRGAWRALEDARIAGAELAGLVKNEIILVDADTQVWAVKSDSLEIRKFPRLALTRKDGTSRTFPDGRVVVAGGHAQSQIIQAIDADCQKPECPLRNFGTGSLKPASRYETFNPATQAWQLSAESGGAGVSAVIRNDGRVMQLGQVRLPRGSGDESAANVQGKWQVEESNSFGTAWRRLPLPTGIGDIQKQDEASCGRGYGEVPFSCTLLIGQLPEGGDLVFLVRARWASEMRHDLWVFDDSAAQWRSLAVNLRTEELATHKPILLPMPGKKVFASTFHPHKVRLWTE